ncbi:hypothetical protein [Mycoplasma sp. 5370]
MTFNFQKNLTKAEASISIKFLSSLIDILLYFSFAFSSLGFLFFLIFKNDYNLAYYFWLFFQIIFILAFQLLIPLLNQGKSIGKIICKLELQTEKKVNKKELLSCLLKRNLFFSLNWVILIFLFILLINPELSQKIVSSNSLLKDKNKQFSNLTSLEKVLINIFIAFSNFNFILLLILFFFNIFNPKKNIINIFSKSKLVYKNKFIETQKPLEIKNLNWTKVQWDTKGDYYEEW